MASSAHLSLIRGYGTALYDAVMASGAGERPLLFLDVDGTLLPFGLPPGQYPVFAGPVGEGVSPLLARLDPGHGARLLALPCDLVWATAWEHEANEVVAPRLGLPELPVVEFPPAEEGDLPGRPALQDPRAGRLGSGPAVCLGG